MKLSCFVWRQYDVYGKTLTTKRVDRLTTTGVVLKKKKKTEPKQTLMIFRSVWNLRIVGIVVYYYLSFDKNQKSSHFTLLSYSTSNYGEERNSKPISVEKIGGSSESMYTNKRPNPLFLPSLRVPSFFKYTDLGRRTSYLWEKSWDVGLLR